MDKRDKMNSLKQLRQAINCTIPQAKKLLQTSNGDMKQAITLFHQSNIDKIIKTYDCPKEMAEKYYHDTQYNMIRTKDVIAKIMEKQRHRQRIFTMREEKFSKNEIGFLIWGEDEDSEDINWGDNYNFIPTTDFHLIISSFKVVFPIYDYWSQEPQHYFDETGQNTFDKQQMAQVIDNICNLKVNNNKEIQFINQVTAWLIELSNQSEIVGVEGNL